MCKTVRSHLQHWDLVYKILEKWACHYRTCFCSSAREAEVMTWDHPGPCNSKSLLTTKRGCSPQRFSGLHETLVRASHRRGHLAEQELEAPLLGNGFCVRHRQFREGLVPVCTVGIKAERQSSLGFYRLCTYKCILNEIANV